MKTFLFIIGILFSAASTTIADGDHMYDEPKGFRGILFGTEFNKVPDMINCIRETKETKACGRKGDKLKIGDAPITGIGYGFYKDKFYVVNIQARGEQTFDSLLETLESTYGKGVRPNQFMNKYHWRGEKMFLFYEMDLRKEIMLVYLYLPVRAEKEAAEKKAAQKGTDDL